MARTHLRRDLLAALLVLGGCGWLPPDTPPARPPPPDPDAALFHAWKVAGHLYVAGSHALTCWSGVCYLLAR